MPECADFELAVDQRLGGALDTAGARALEAHLDSCESCRAYEASVRLFTGDLRATAARGQAEVDWDHIEIRVRERSRGRVRNLFIGVGIGVTAGALATWGMSEPGERTELAITIAIIIGVAVAARAFFVAREIRIVSGLARGGALLAGHREMLARDVRTIRRFRWLALATVLGIFGHAFVEDHAWATVADVAIGLLVAGLWTRTLLVTYPRIVRELAELDRGRERS